ncbi:MAG TPA: chemotaxis protein CheA, partial [Firmicutes bacterium]|nr:chemotaxis protein CheA [Bacillota bacterium]
MDMENYKDVFLEEARENINLMNKSLLIFEKDIEDLTPVNELFRAAHTIKGMSATMGYDRLARFTHIVEEVLDGLRSGEIKADKDVVDVLYKSADVMDEFVENIASTGKDISVRSEETAEKAAAVIRPGVETAGRDESVKKETVPEAAKKISGLKDNRVFEIEVEEAFVKEAGMQGLNAYRIKVVIAETCAFKNVRAFMTVRNLSEKGEVIKSIPAAKDIEEGNFEGNLEFVLISKYTQEEIGAAVRKIAEIEDVFVEKTENAAEASEDGVAAENKKDNQKTGGDDKEKKAVLSRSVRVNVDKLDALMNLVGELVINKIRLTSVYNDKKYEMLKETVDEFDRVIDELQLEVTDVRMLPVSSIFDRYPRMVRDLASQEGKKIELEIKGGDIEIDRTVLEEINEPIMHLIRNSAAHGVESPEQRQKAGKNPSGIIRLSAGRERNSVVIEVSDDGAGIDIEKVRKKAVQKGIISEEKSFSVSEEELVNIIAMPGFSTQEKVTQVSGRGVGVDVVKTKVESFGGIFKIENFPGEGIKFILKLPLTLAIIQA